MRERLSRALNVALRSAAFFSLLVICSLGSLVACVYSALLVVSLGAYTMGALFEGGPVGEGVISVSVAVWWVLGLSAGLLALGVCFYPVVWWMDRDLKRYPPGR